MQLDEMKLTPAEFDYARTVCASELERVPKLNLTPLMEMIENAQRESTQKAARAATRSLGLATTYAGSGVQVPA